MDIGTNPAVREAARILSGWIGWVGASVVGLTAICYTAGFFVMQAHLKMLGISQVMETTNDQFLFEGGIFLYNTITEILLTGVFVIPPIIVVWLLLKAISRIPIDKARKATGYLMNSIKSKKAKNIFAYLVPILSIILIILHYDLYYYQISSLKQFNNIAFASPRDLNSFTADLTPLLFTGDREVLLYSYSYLVSNCTVFLSVIWIMIYKVDQTPLGWIAKAFFISYTAMLVMLLPFAYGVLVRSPDYPVANVTFKNGQQSSALILQRTADNLLVWNQVTHHAVSYDNSDISSIEIVGEQSILQEAGGR